MIFYYCMSDLMVSYDFLIKKSMYPDLITNPGNKNLFISRRHIDLLRLNTILVDFIEYIDGYILQSQLI